MSNKTRNDAKAKTESAPRSYLLAAISGLVVAAFVAGIVFLVILSPGSKSLNKNCDGSATKSEIFHCNISELEYAVDPQQRTLGLSGRDKLADNQALLLVYEEPSRQCIWMKDMKFNLDIVWLDENHKIIKLLKDVSPDTYPTNFCTDGTRYILEANSGTMDRIGIGVGDLIQL